MFLFFLELFFNDSVLLLDFSDVVGNGGEEVILMDGDELGEDILDDLSVGEGLEVATEVL